MTTALMPTTDCASHLVLLELAADLGITDVRDPDRLATLIRLDVLEQQSKARQSQGDLHIATHMTLPSLRADLRSARRDRDELYARAKEAEQRVAVGISLIVLLGAVLVATISVFAEIPQHAPALLSAGAIGASVAVGYWLALSERLLEWKRAVVNSVLNFWYTKVDR